MTARGFTLLEVLVALAILSLTVVVSIQGFASGLRLLKLSGDHQEAILIADLKARDVSTPQEGHENGTEGDFMWERTVKALPAPDLDIPGRTTKWHVFEIDVKVTWGFGSTRAVEVMTLRTVAESTKPEIPQ
jgi:prepilin-type N-terminal cleavage/methylation domain-containing protein